MLFTVWFGNIVALKFIINGGIYLKIDFASCLSDCAEKLRNVDTIIVIIRSCMHYASFKF